jgi:MoxR-like ATPase
MRPTIRFEPRTGEARRYLYTDQLVLAVRVALATDRVLLVTGDPGTGKSTLAEDIADTLGFAFHSLVVTSHTEANDFLYAFDQVERLNDAYAQAVVRTKHVSERARYVRPGVLWWAFDPESAHTRFDPRLPPLPDALAPRTAPGAVVLIDEIDKADPDVPNDLLVPLDRKTFFVAPLSTTVNRAPTRRVLIIVTSNGERELPQAFLRRCVTARLSRPDASTKVGQKLLFDLAISHFRNASSARLEPIVDAVVKVYLVATKTAAELNVRAPATAEFLDAVGAGLEFAETFPEVPLPDLIEAALWKHPTPLPRGSQ